MAIAHSINLQIQRPVLRPVTHGLFSYAALEWPEMISLSRRNDSANARSALSLSSPHGTH